MSVPDLSEPMRVKAKIRYAHQGAFCLIEKIGGGQSEMYL